MATYYFEQTTQAQAATFVSTDSLYFLSDTVANLSVTNTPGTQLQNASTTLSENGVMLTFNADALAYASQNGGITFTNGDALKLGSDNSADTLTATAAASGHDELWGFGGNDVLTGSTASDTIIGGEGDDQITAVSNANTTDQDFLFGGNGADTITGSAGNEHIFGNALTTVSGTADGNDVINAGAGRDYVNGNAGDDSISGGNGDDQLYGGNGVDTINGGNQQDYLQGNKGNDILNGDAGNDTLRGGADNDSLSGGADDDHLSGDNGNDTIVGGTGVDDLSGGNGADLFVFNSGDNGIANLTSASSANSHDAVDFINDYVHGTDHLRIFNNAGTPAAIVPSAIDTGTASSADAAYYYAKGLLSTGTHTGEVAAVQVGADTYLFYDSAQPTGTQSVDSVILLKGVTATTLTTGTGGDFI